MEIVGYTDRLSAPPGSPEAGTQNPLVRADMVYFEGPDDGAVFSVGSTN